MPRTWKLGVARIYGLDQVFLNNYLSNVHLILTVHGGKHINHYHCETIEASIM